ncbi:CLUMA_CG020616, isoform A [Clunio marinus]|uniref:CLUMA_CG020616, isoform A n=1 Tax=Clunio marinus TaxID=568069 RepID=A0A1J1J5H6_9DIPT|nr:CLUMA_CG020616, isoform A [Clunio marinus]
MTKKGGVQQLQTEICNDDDLDKFLERDGIIVLDVYSEWAGPCVGMIGYLKKAKLEIGGDFLHLAVCKSDTIEKLKRFRNRSEPTWLFCSNHKIVNMLLGCNVPRLMAIIIQELKFEEQFKAGEFERTFYDFEQLLPEEEEREALLRTIEEETDRIEAEQAIQQRKEYIQFVTDEIIKHVIDMGIMLFFPHVMKDAYRKSTDVSDKMELSCKDRKMIRIKPEMMEILQFEIENPLDEEVIEYLYTKEILIFLMKLGETDTRAPEEVLKIFYKAIAEPNIVYYDETGEKIIHSSPAILEPIEFVPGHEPVFVEKPLLRKGKQQAAQAPQVVIPIDEATGLPMKLMKVPPCWTPFNKRGNAAYIYIFFRNYTEHFLPPDPEMVPQHLLFIFDAYKRQNIFDAFKPVSSDVLAFGYFSSEIITSCTLLAKITDKYELLKPTVNDKLMLKVAKKRSDIVKRLKLLGPCYVSKNTVDGKADCEKLFPPDYNVEEEEPENESCGNEGKKKKKKRRKKREKVEGDADQSTTTEQMSAQDSEDTLDDLSPDEEELNHDGKEGEGNEAPPPSPNH